MTRDVPVLRETDSEAARDAARALAEAMIRATIDSATDRLFIQPLLQSCTNRAVHGGLNVRIV